MHLKSCLQNIDYFVEALMCLMIAAKWRRMAL